MLFILAFAALFSGAGSPQAAETASTQRAITQGLQAIAQDRWTAAQGLMAGTHDPLAAKLYFWLYFQNARGKGDTDNYVRLVQFIRQNPDWPGMTNLYVQAEHEMPLSLSSQEVIAWHNDYPPRSAKGLFRYLAALMYTGRQDQAKTLINDWWANKTLNRNDQKAFYEKYASFITPESHRKRLSNLLFEKQYTNARAVAGVLGEGYLKLAEARIALSEDKGDINALISRVPRDLQSDPGLIYERLHWRRVHDLDDAAIELLNIQPEFSRLSNPDDWWQERHIIIRRLLEEKKYKQAYNLAKAHGQKEGLSFAQGEWMAGWLALRFLHDKPRALQHFETLYGNVKTPISQSRAAYWAGRAAEDLGQAELARSWYTKAAQYQTTFYGQTAGAELGLNTALTYASPPKLTSADVNLFNSNDLIRAARLFHAAGQRDRASQFLQAFIKSGDNPDPKAYVFAASVAADIKHPYDVVKIAKKATEKGLFLSVDSYPIVPQYLGSTQTDWALVHSLIRQESQFDTSAKSSAGALGLMQLMPATAKEVAGKMGVGHQTHDLVNSPSHNVMLGTQYITRLLNKYAGSYPLAIAAYNAGPGRVDEWLRVYGDPRTGQIDLIDWIELIPIYETRNYVQRVMEGIYVYHFRLKNIDKETPQPIHIARANQYR